MKLKSKSITNEADESKIDFIKDNIDHCSINYIQTETLYQKNLLESSINKLLDYFNCISIEIKYPSDNFNDIYNLVSSINEKEVLQLKNEMVESSMDEYEENDDQENYDHNKATNETSKIQIELFISDIESIDQKFNGNELLYKLKFGSNVKIINAKTYPMLDFHLQLRVLVKILFMDALN